MNQVEVRIRHEDESDAVPLFSWDAGRLDEVIPLVERWGLSYRYETQTWDMSGQFVLDSGSAFFEVLLSDPGDEP